MDPDRVTAIQTFLRKNEKIRFESGMMNKKQDKIFWV